MSSNVKIEQIKLDFPILNHKLQGSNVIYLDSAATTQCPTQVIQSMVKFYETSNANVHRGLHKLSQKATVEYERAREKVAEFINAEREEIIFTSGTTEGLNFLAQTLKNGLKKGDEIVLTEMEHHSNIVPWQKIVEETGAVIRFIPVKEYELDLKKGTITKKTKIVSVVHMSNMLGTINPVGEIVKMAHNVGAICIVDAAQSVPHMPIDVKKMDVDFLVFSGHKMLGPTGIGVLYGKKKLLETLEPYKFGGGMIREVTLEKSTWADIPERFEAGTPNIAGAIGLAAAIEYLQEKGMKNVEKQCAELTKYAKKRLSKIKGVTIIGPKNQGPIISFTIDGVHPHDASEILDRYNIAVRAGHHCTMPLHRKLGFTGTTRASFYIYNTKEDVDALVKGVEKVKEVFRI